MKNLDAIYRTSAEYHGVSDIDNPAYDSFVFDWVEFEYDPYSEDEDYIPLNDIDSALLSLR
jgi:hypothetical protein